MPATISGPVRMQFLQYTVNSTRQMHETIIRVLVPDNIDAFETPRVVFVLPASPDLSHRSGDCIQEILVNDLHNRHGMVIVAPTFAEWPWMTDHPDNQRYQQVLFLLEDIVTHADTLFPGSKRLLLGYSKGGTAAMQMLLRYPQVFEAIAFFDSPIMKELPDQWEMPYFWTDPERYRDFAIPTLLKERGHLLGNDPRIAMFGYGNFGKNAPEWTFDHLTAGHELMTDLGIPHIYENATYREHRWDSGWVESAFAALEQMSGSARIDAAPAL